ncbi:acyltransferase [Bacillus sp. FJAT-27251]|uniref:acyltransferase n=1 Tax=Bacillus sp. FJAT-27251 TaxID=1684142 RepID=UPI0018D03CA3|nr:acyltransferase [Bacillus sp. FJAT-27251]
MDKNVDVMPKRFVKFIANYYTDARIRKKYWRKLGIQMGKNTYPNLGFQSTSNGEDLVVIGDNVSIAPNVVLVTESNANNGKEINEIPYVRNRLTKKEKIIIEDEVWIGTNVVILPGVTVGKCSIIGAGSIVTKDVEPYSIYTGIPARKSGSLL